MFRRFSIVFFFTILCPLMIYWFGLFIYSIEILKEDKQQQPIPGTSNYYMYVFFLCGLLMLALIGVIGFGVYAFLRCAIHYIKEDRWYF